jgi:hypothetical protein
MKAIKPVLFFLFISILFEGCYWYETLTMRIDLASKTGKLEFSNIVSLPDKEGQRWRKKDIQRDWDDFLKAYQENGLMDNKNMEVTQKELFNKEKQLDAVVQFKYADLKDLDIIKSPDNTMYLMKKGPEDKVLETNGKTIMVDSVEYIGWDANVKEIFVKYELLDKNKKRYSLLPYYEKWKKNEGKGK